MLESLVEWMSYPLYYAYDGAPPPARAGASHATIYPYGLFPAGDGKTVLLGLQNEREWAAFCEVVLRQPGLASEERFSSNFRRNAARDELRRIIVEAFSTLTAEQVIARLDEARIANSRANDMHDVWEHPQLKARNRWRRWKRSGVPSRRCCLPVPGKKAIPAWTPVPALGQHTDAILSALGYTPERIESLRAEKAV